MATLQTNEIESESQPPVGGNSISDYYCFQLQFTFVHDLIIILSFSAHIHDAHKTYHNDIMTYFFVKDYLS